VVRRLICFAVVIGSAYLERLRGPAITRSIGNPGAETRELRSGRLYQLRRARLGHFPVGLFVARDERSAVLIAVPAAAGEVRLARARDVDLGLVGTVTIRRVRLLRV